MPTTPTEVLLDDIDDDNPSVDRTSSQPRPWWQATNTALAIAAIALAIGRGPAPTPPTDETSPPSTIPATTTASTPAPAAAGIQDGWERARIAEWASRQAHSTLPPPVHQPTTIIRPGQGTR